MRAADKRSVLNRNFAVKNQLNALAALAALRAFYTRGGAVRLIGIISTPCAWHKFVAFLLSFASAVSLAGLNTLIFCAQIFLKSPRCSCG
jgi:hypothetical protein